MLGEVSAGLEPSKTDHRSFSYPIVLGRGVLRGFLAVQQARLDLL